MNIDELACSSNTYIYWTLCHFMLQANFIQYVCSNIQRSYVQTFKGLMLESLQSLLYYSQRLWPEPSMGAE